MKILLVAVNAKYIHSNPAVYSLRAYAGKEYEKQIEIAEYTINQRLQGILADICEKRPDVAAFSCYIWNWRLIAELIEELHKVMPLLPIWLGGPEVSFDGEKILREHPEVTGIMTGEGEQTFQELVRYYVGEASTEEEALAGLHKIRGILYRQGEDIFTSGLRELTDLNTIPFLYQEPEAFRNRIIYYESSRGCPFRCSYCLSSIDKTVRLRDTDRVKEELQYFLDHKVPQVKFIDRTFNCNHEHTMEIWRYIHEHDNGVTNFHFEIAADIMREEELELLSRMRPGLVQLEIGVQSANPDTLKEIDRYVDMERLKTVVKLIRKGRNVHIHLDLIAGLPFEDYSSFGHSFDVVYAMRPEQLQLGFLKVLKGSPIHEKAGSYGINYTSFPPYEVLYSKWLSFREICRLKRIEEMVELYYNSNQFIHTLTVLESVFPGPFAMFEALADYYEKEGYFVNSPSRAYRYDVMLQFACAYDGERKALYKELLTYDMYLRENMKSRPAFALDLKAYKEKIRQKAGQKTRALHVEVFHYAVWEDVAAKCAVRLQEPVFLLFDYERRNPLNGEAAVERI